MSATAWQSLGPYRGAIAATVRCAALERELAGLSRLSAGARSDVLHAGRHLTTRLSLSAPEGALEVAVKCFGRQSLFKDRWDARYGSQAARAFAAACYLAERGIGTPQPVACLERWAGSRLLECYLVTRYLDNTVSFKDELIRLFEHEPECASFMALLETVAHAVRRLHDAGCRHRDLGNQNILLGPPPATPEQRREVYFIDLNRARCGRALSSRDRARDLSRIALPSDLLRVFFGMYWQAPPPRAFRRCERLHRALFAGHTLTRRLRHPLRRDRVAAAASRVPSGYPAPREQWVWDARSAQPIPTLRPHDRYRHIAPTQLPWLLAGAIPAAPAVYRHWMALRREAFATPVPIHRAVAVALSG
ncbi:MAG: lipopolysaccharide kinase InaA family protein, partial [Kiritimatiellae bacterium]|nr:lipopolysaccharide kinase InaA family protein [Kiritimatiellia bacterium]